MRQWKVLDKSSGLVWTTFGVVWTTFGVVALVCLACESDAGVVGDTYTEECDAQSGLRWQDVVDLLCPALEDAGLGLEADCRARGRELADVCGDDCYYDLAEMCLIPFDHGDTDCSIVLGDECGSLTSANFE